MKYDVIYIDPPWKYNSKKTGGSFKSGACQAYPVMSFKQIRDINIGAIAAEDSYLFMWVTVPLLDEAIKIMNGWGFKYKTALFWDKVRLGMGYWFRGQVEVLLVGSKGDALALKNPKVRNLYSEKPIKHSAKPSYYRKLIGLSTPYLRRVELFARERCGGWDSIGYDLSKMDINQEIDKLSKILTKSEEM